MAFVKYTGIGYLLPKSEISDPDIDLMFQKFSSLASRGHSKAGQVEVGIVIAKKI